MIIFNQLGYLSIVGHTADRSSRVCYLEFIHYSRKQSRIIFYPPPWSKFSISPKTLSRGEAVVSLPISPLRIVLHKVNKNGQKLENKLHFCRFSTFSPPFLDFFGRGQWAPSKKKIIILLYFMALGKPQQNFLLFVARPLRP